HLLRIKLLAGSVFVKARTDPCHEQIGFGSNLYLDSGDAVHGRFYACGRLARRAAQNVVLDLLGSCHCAWLGSVPDLARDWRNAPHDRGYSASVCGVLSDVLCAERGDGIPDCAA